MFFFSPAFANLLTSRQAKPFVIKTVDAALDSESASFLTLFEIHFSFFIIAFFLNAGSTFVRGGMLCGISSKYKWEKENFCYPVLVI